MIFVISKKYHYFIFIDTDLGGLGIQTLKDIQLYLNHEDDQLKAAAITVFVNAEKCRFRALGEQLHGWSSKNFASFVKSPKFSFSFVLKRHPSDMLKIAILQNFVAHSPHLYMMRFVFVVLTAAARY